VAIEGMRFSPERLEVAAGDRVTWVNRDVVPHTVTDAAAGIESGEIAAGASWTLVARRKGETAYVCRFHPGMHGALTVR
jgi:plastocyanin